MAATEDNKGAELNGIQVCVRVRPLNDRERDAGYRNCISFDEATQQVVLSAVDRSTLMQLRGQTAKGYAFDRRYGPEHTSDNIYDDCVCHLVDNLFKGYNATVLAYGQTGTGKTLTMSGGKGIYENSEKGIIRRAAEHILANVEAVKAKQKPGESITVRAYALELYNEELRDLSSKVAAVVSALDRDGSSSSSEGVRIAERPVGKDGRCIPEVVGVTTVEVADAESLVNFFADCFDNRAVAATKMNDRSSRSHAIYTVLINRTIVDVSEVGDKVRTERVESRFNLVDLAGSERVKRSGVTGAAFKEAVHINGGLLALGNVIVALSGGHEGPEEEAAGAAAAALPTGSATAAAAAAKPAAKKHIPYRDSKLTRLLQDSLGGSALTALISCISCCEADFEETNSTLKYANRACKVKNAPLPNKQLLLEEDLLPLLPSNIGSGGGQMSMMQMQLLLAEHNRMKETREKREAERKEKDEKRLAELRALKEAETKTPGFQRLRMAQYDDLRKKLVSSHGGKLVKGEIIQDETLAGFKKRGTSEGDGSGSEDSGRPSYMRGTTASRVGSPIPGSRSRPSSARLYSNTHVRASGSGPLEGGESLACSSAEILTIGDPATDNEQQEGAGSDLEGEQSEAAGSDVGANMACVGEAAQAAGALRSGSVGLSGLSGLGQTVKQMHKMAIGTEDYEEGAVAGAERDGLAVAQQSKTATVAVDEGTCMSPKAAGGDTIKAFYEPGSMEEAYAQADAAAPAETAGGSRRSSMSRASSAMPAGFYTASSQQQGPSSMSRATSAAADLAGGGGTISRRSSIAAIEAATAAAAVVPPVPSAPTAARSAAFEVLAFNTAQPEASQAQPGSQAQASPVAEVQSIPPLQLLARFRVNQSDTLAVFRAVSPEDFADVASLLPPNTALPAADKMTYLIARLELHPYTSEQLCAAIDSVAAGVASIAAAVGPAVGCLMATFGTSLITDCIYDFEDPEQLADTALHQRLELWGLQIPHTSIRPALSAEEKVNTNSTSSHAAVRPRSPSPEVTPRRSSSSSPVPNGRRSSQLGSSQQHGSPQQHGSSLQHGSPLGGAVQQQEQQTESVTCWSSADRLNVSIGLMYALCNLAKEVGAVAGFCVPRPQLLRRWLQAGVRMKQVSPPTKLIYPPSAHDYAYYKSSTVAYFVVDEVKASLSKVLSMLRQTQQQ